MPVINTAPSTPLTPAQQLANAVVQQQAQMQTLWRQITNVMNLTASFVYNCPLANGTGSKFSAQDVFNAYGTNAADLCKLSEAVVTMIGTYTGITPAIPPAGYSIQVNVDGTVTVTNPPPPTAPAPK
jgi:hypothetical protein